MDYAYIKSIFKRRKITNDIISGIEDTGAKAYDSILDFIALTVAVFAQRTSLTDGRTDGHRSSRNR